ncbi:UDP-glucose 4-epimerase [Halospina denitrificans]|uniref:UDP-glucose 4-epimerase n=1 Tax=Halospina denitrificans TaxID=332522 RepID=A0A4R7JSY9_9GAMM|nr:SDR family oxidoreductase [Halospina denitrificans]TDT41412.1 UDP-glucose 4-epimerase [Halospina denitrificans]
MTQSSKPALLVTGAAGALAQQVIQRLRKDYQVVAVDFRQEVWLGPDIPSYRIDLSKRGFEDLFRRFQFQGVIHLGRIMSSQETRLRRYNANVLGTDRLLSLSDQYGVSRVIVLSTYHVYGANPYNPALIDESYPLKSAGLTMDLVDSVELENLATIYLWRNPNLNVTLLRPCNIVGPGVRNTMSSLLSARYAPTMAGFSPMMQFIHSDDMANAIETAFRQRIPGIFNVAPHDWVSYRQALEECGCRPVPIPSVPPVLPRTMLRALKLRRFPSYLMDFFKYPVIIDGRNFSTRFGFEPERSLDSIFRYYRELRYQS